MLPWLAASFGFGAALAGLLLVLAFFRSPARRQWAAGFVESEGQPSSRLSMANVVTVFTLALQWWRPETPLALIEANFFFAGTLYGFGTVKVVASRFAPKPTTDPTEQEEKPGTALG